MDSSLCLQNLIRLQAIIDTNFPLTELDRYLFNNLKMPFSEVEKIIENRLKINKEWGVPYNDTGNMFYFELEAAISIINRNNEKEKRRQEQEQATSNAKVPKINPSQYMRSLPKLK